MTLQTKLTQQDKIILRNIQHKITHILHLDDIDRSILQRSVELITAIQKFLNTNIAKQCIK